MPPCRRAGSRYSSRDQYRNHRRRQHRHNSLPSFLSFLHHLCHYGLFIIFFVARNTPCTNAQYYSGVRSLPTNDRWRSSRRAFQVCFVGVADSHCLTGTCLSCSRFILNLPDEELASAERVCFQVEQASVVFGFPRRTAFELIVLS